MDSGHLNWGADALWQQLEPLLPGMSVEVLAQCESTNTRLLDRARAVSGRPSAPVTRPGELDHPGVLREEPVSGPYGRRTADVQPCLLVAEHQTRGRGRQGHDWVAHTGVSLTFSLALPLAPADWSGLSLAVGLALAQALDGAADGATDRATDPAADRASDGTTDGTTDGAADDGAGSAPLRVLLKWPNDLWLCDAPGRGRKLGGVLIETVSVGTNRMCVVGVGLNVLPQSLDGLAHGYACLQELHPDITAPQALAQVAAPLARALCAFQAQGFAPLVAAYAQRDLLLGQQVTTTQPGVPAGVAEGVDARGALRVRSGDLHHVVSGEVSVRLHGQALEQQPPTPDDASAQPALSTLHSNP